MTWEEYKQKARSKGWEAQVPLAVDETLGQIIGAVADRRVDLGWSQRELAQRCGLTQSAVARVESGTTTPRVDTLVRMLEALGLYLRAVCSDEPEQGGAVSIVLDTLSVAVAAGKAVLTDDSIRWSGKEITKEVRVHA